MRPLLPAVRAPPCVCVRRWGQAFRDVIPALVLMFYTFLFVWFVGGLSGFHIYLSATNQTTYENFRCVRARAL